MSGSLTSSTPQASSPLAIPVGSFATRPAVFVHQSDTLRAIADTLASELIGAVLVRGPSGLVGIVSERDVVQALADGADPDVERALDVMTADMVTARAETPVGEVLDAMLASEIRHVPVLGEPERVHMASARDILIHLAAHLSAERANGEVAPG
jgi:CBS domain-containing protein